MGHRDYKTMLIYADYAPVAHERELVEKAFRASNALAARLGRSDASGRSARCRRRRAYPGPPYVVRWHPDAAAERDASWPPDEKIVMEHAVEKLQALGPRLKHPALTCGAGQRG